MDADFELQRQLYFTLLEKHLARKDQIEQAVQRYLGEHASEIKEMSIRLSELSTEEIASVIQRAPVLLKSLSAICNIAQRTFLLGTGMNVDTYAERISPETALKIASFLKEFLPERITLGALLLTDQWWYIDKEMRRIKGNVWEELVRQTVERMSGMDFPKRKFRSGKEFEIDAANPSRGPIEIGIDIKRISSPRDIHKRSDEIVNKAEHLKRVFPHARFFAVVFYPIEDKEPFESRFEDSKVDSIFYAGEKKESIEKACDSLLIHAQIERRFMNESLEDHP